jgi:uncharacterized protein YraI
MYGCISTFGFMTGKAGTAKANQYTDSIQAKIVANKTFSHFRGNLRWKINLNLQFN